MKLHIGGQRAVEVRSSTGRTNDRLPRALELKAENDQKDAQAQKPWFPPSSTRKPREKIFDIISARYALLLHNEASAPDVLE